MRAPLRVLCLDIEGGYGGSSRSLVELLRHVDRDAVAPEVWCRRDGPTRARLKALEIPVRVMPDMPKVSSLPRLSRNLAVYGRFALDWASASAFRRALLERIAGGIDLMHCNHEALFWLARWLRRQGLVPLTGHIRTNPWDTPFARFQARTIARSFDHLVFITENEWATVERLAGRSVAGTVIHNVAMPSEAPVEPHPAVPRDGRFRIASLSNYSWSRGVDRLVEVAEAAARRGRRDLCFVVAGDMTLPRSLPGGLGRVARRGGTLADWAAERAVADMFVFVGHVVEPERVLAACHMLAKPTREANPWGRDIIEAMAAGTPVASCGSYCCFVEDSVTGVLQPEFDVLALTERLIALADDRTACEALGKRARERVRRLCDGPARAAELAAVWGEVASTAVYLAH